MPNDCPVSEIEFKALTCTLKAASLKSSTQSAIACAAFVDGAMAVLEANKRGISDIRIKEDLIKVNAILSDL